MSASSSAVIAQMLASAPLSERLARFELAVYCASPSIWASRGISLRGHAPSPADLKASPLAGKLFAVKDNIDVAGYKTAATCPGFAHKRHKTATVVQRLLDAGASMAGKTSLDQSTHGPVGARSPCGIVPNAFDARYISGGSSAGSAVAVALGLVDFSLGTDTTGSGPVSAGLNNIVGLKPSRGLLSTHGMLPTGAHIDCPSIFARTVSEAVEVMMAAAGHDPQDPFSRALELDARAFPTQFNFGVPDRAHLQFFGDHFAAVAFREACARLTSLGGNATPIDYTPWSNAATVPHEDAQMDERHDAVDPFCPMMRIAAHRRRADALWPAVDVMIVPTAPVIYTIAEIDAHPIKLNHRLGYYTNVMNLLDTAAIAVPSSIRPDGLPFGITLIGPAGSELRLADLAARYHAATGLTLGTSTLPVPAPRIHRQLAGLSGVTGCSARQPGDMTQAR